MPKETKHLESPSLTAYIAINNCGVKQFSKEIADDTEGTRKAL